MKLDKTSRVYINCRTQEEQEMVLDILDHIDIRWYNNKRPRELKSFVPPMGYVIINDRMYHDKKTRVIYDNNTPVIEAKDFRNQWIALKKGLDK